MKRVDANQAAITATFRRLGFAVAHTHMIGNGFPDLVIAKPLPCPHCEKHIPQTLLVEIKDGSKPPSARKLTPDEEKFHQLWRGRLVIVQSVEDALRLAGAK